MNSLDKLLIHALGLGGSDLHLSVGAPPKTRIDGTIIDLNDAIITAAQMETMLKEVTPRRRWEQFNRTGDVDLSHEIPGTARFRMNIFRNNWGMATVLRQVPARVASIDELGLPQCLKDVAEYKSGLVLVTGPTGSGKSTTIAAILNHINENQQKLITTIEDPIEFTHEDKRSTIIHREVTEHTHSFESGLRGAMRANQDVILIGEMRDMETIRLALNCAAMGTLVFATLHTNNAAKTVDRIIDVFPSEEQNLMRIMLAESLSAILSQLLCRKASGGRIAAHEILLQHPSLANSIRTNSLSNIQNVIDQNRERGMISMDASLKNLLDAGVISRQEAYMKAINKSDFEIV